MNSCIRIKVRHFRFFFFTFLSEVIHSSMIFNYLDLYVIYSKLCDTVIIWILWIKHAMDWKKGDDTRACVHVHSTQFTSFLFIFTQQVLNAFTCLFHSLMFIDALFSIYKEKKERSRVQGPGFLLLLLSIRGLITINGWYFRCPIYLWTVFKWIFSPSVDSLDFYGIHKTIWTHRGVNMFYSTLKKL